MRVIGLDPALKTGWAINDDTGIRYGTWDIDANNPARNLAYRLLEMTARVEYLLASENPDVVVYEQVQFVRSMSQVTLSAMWRGIIVLQSAKRGIRVEGVPVGTLKKFATGSGKADKAMMIDAARHEIWDTDAVLSSDEADAILLAVYGREKFK
jgi:Holliday junction resolvasome RuvABC endonuclease subunit